MSHSAIHTSNRGSAGRVQPRREHIFKRRHAGAKARGRDAERGPGSIVVGVDGRKRSKDALALAATLAEYTGGDLQLVHAHGYGPLEHILGDGGYRALVRTAFNASFYQVKEVVGEGHAREMRAIPDASPAAGLGRIAESEGAQMIVVGPSRRTGLGRLRPSGVTERLLSGASVPVAVAPRGYSSGERRLATVACAFDGSPEARLALDWADELARRSDAQLRVISVHSPIAFGDLGVDGAFSRESTNEALRDAIEREQLEAITGRRAHAVVLTGNPARELARASRDTDILVMGSRGYGPVRATLLGGVSQYVLRHSSCAVVVCPRGAVEEGSRSASAS
jgi:nucleotide-binding universal stress UspA family protein